MFKLIKELMNLRKSIEEKTKELNRLEKDINNRENIINNIKQNAQNEANIKSEEIINQGRQKLANIEEEISKKGKYINEVQEIKSEYEKISKKVSSQEKKLTKAKSIYNRIQYILEKFDLNVGDEVYIYTGAPYSAIFLKCSVRAILNYDETINDEEFLFDNEDSTDIARKPRYVRLVPIKNYLNKIDKVNSNKLKEHGVKGFSFQIQLSQETIDYLDSI